MTAKTFVVCDRCAQEFRYDPHEKVFPKTASLAITSNTIGEEGVDLRLDLCEDCTHKTIVSIHKDYKAAKDKQQG